MMVGIVLIVCCQPSCWDVVFTVVLDGGLRDYSFLVGRALLIMNAWIWGLLSRSTEVA